MAAFFVLIFRVEQRGEVPGRNNGGKGHGFHGLDGYNNTTAFFDRNKNESTRTATAVLRGYGGCGG